MQDLPKAEIDKATEKKEAIGKLAEELRTQAKIMENE